MVCRIWHGWTSGANAEAYERLLRTEIFPGIAAHGIAQALLARFEPPSAHYEVRPPRGAS